MTAALQFSGCAWQRHVPAMATTGANTETVEPRLLDCMTGQHSNNHVVAQCSSHKPGGHGPAVNNRQDAKSNGKALGPHNTLGLNRSNHFGHQWRKHWTTKPIWTAQHGTTNTGLSDHAAQQLANQDGHQGLLDVGWQAATCTTEQSLPMPHYSKYAWQQLACWQCQSASKVATKVHARQLKQVRLHDRTTPQQQTSGSAAQQPVNPGRCMKITALLQIQDSDQQRSQDSAITPGA